MTGQSFEGEEWAKRKQFMAITPAVSELLPQIWSVIKPALPEILEGFYAHAGSVPELAKMIGDQSARLKAAQTTHWERLFSGRFDDDYIQGIRAIGLTHNRIGLEPRWYIGGYNFVQQELIAVLVKHYRWKPAKLASAIQAVMAAINLDMGMAISIYQEAMMEEREKRGKVIAEITDTFDSTASEIVGTVSAAASQLKGTAQQMSTAADDACRQATAVAAASEQATANVQTVASAADELSASVSEINRQMGESSEIARKANAEAERTNETV